MPEKKARGPITFVRRPRSKKADMEVAFVATAPKAPKARAQFLKIGHRRNSVHVVNRAARFPPNGAWPMEMRADTLAAYLDFATTRDLCRAIARGEAPAPNATRGTGKDLDVVWYGRAVQEFVARRNLYLQ